MNDREEELGSGEDDRGLTGDQGLEHIKEEDEGGGKLWC